MAEQANIETINRVYEAFGRGDIPFIIGQLTDDVVWRTHLDPIVPWSGDYDGKANAPRFFEALGSAVDVTSFTPQEFVAQGDSVVSMGGFGFRAKVSGKQDTSNWVFIWKFRDGRICSYEQFHDPAVAAPFR